MVRSSSSPTISSSPRKRGSPDGVEPKEIPAFAGMTGGEGEGAVPSRRFSYLRDPEAIYRQSFATIRAEARLDRFPPDVAGLAIRVAHTYDMVEMIDDLLFTPDVAARDRTALTAGAPMLVD